MRTTLDERIPALPESGRKKTRPVRAPWPHVHWFRLIGDDPFSGATLYRCRCGQVRPGF